METISSQIRSRVADKPGSIVLLNRNNSLFSVEELATAASAQPECVRKFIAVGLIEPSRQTFSGPLFRRSSLERLLRIMRLRRDLGINLAGIAAVLDMRERIEILQKEVERLQRLQFAK
jgi:MerR family transcriptional regulator/heat shock protein HspR